MTLIEEKKARLRRHFGDRPVAWVPFWGISKLRLRGGIFAGEIPGDMIDYDKWYARMLRPGYLTSGKLLEKIKALNPPEFTVEGGVTASLRRTPEGVEFMQLLDYRSPEESREVTVKFTRERAGVYRSLDGEEKTFRAKELALPGFRVYGRITFAEK